jgi:hypothetical protein
MRKRNSENTYMITVAELDLKTARNEVKNFAASKAYCKFSIKNVV